ncbi:exopolysaccharide biosynthesis protein [Oceanimonas sp. NS1]|nr:exopolysaccharide biosynthesis protein [Oceanimonas sp. NS1]
MRVLGMALVAFTLSGCANMGFDSNVSPAGIKDYYKGSNVKLYGREELKATNYVSLGTVEGEACQIESQDPPPKDADARADIRRRAADMGANGICWIAAFALKTCPVALSRCYAAARHWWLTSDFVRREA